MKILIAALLLAGLSSCARPSLTPEEKREWEERQREIHFPKFER